ncbi:hypothetical protein CHUAL_010344 [Chamberlinius hualienensis]
MRQIKLEDVAADGRAITLPIKVNDISAAMKSGLEEVVLQRERDATYCDKEKDQSQNHYTSVPLHIRFMAESERKMK